MKTFLSVSVDSRNICLVEGGFAKDDLAVRKAQRFDLPGVCIKNDVVADELLFADTLQNAVRAGGFSAKNVILSIGNKRAFIKELDLPVAKPKEIDGMIRSELHQTFNVSTTDIVQYKTIGGRTNDKGEKLVSYRVAALDRELVESYYRALERAKLKPVSLDISLNVIDNLAVWGGSLNGKSRDYEAVLLIDFGHTSSTVYIVSRDLPLFYRLLDFNVKDVWQFSRDEFGISGDHGGDESSLDALNLFEGRDVRDVYKNSLRPFFYKFNDEILKTATFFNKESSSSTISQAYLFGPGSQIKGISEYWSANLSLPVELLTALGGNNMSDSSLAPLFINAASALIRQK